MGKINRCERIIKYLILGAGVSGLSFANNVRNQDYLILEKNSEPGGYCRSTVRGDYVWDYAGHFFHFSRPDLKKRFREVLQSDDIVYRQKNTKIFYNGQYVDYPFQKNIHQLEKQEMIECLCDLFEKHEKENYDSFLDMLYGKFGVSITEKFLKPYNEKLYACNLNLLDVEAMGRFFPYANLNEIIQNMRKSNNDSYNNDFLYPKEGAAVFVRHLLNGLNPDLVHLGEEVRSIDIDQKTVVTESNTYHYDYLISSLPLNSFIRLIGKENLLEEHPLSFNQVLVLNLGFDKPSIDRDIHWIYIPSPDTNFYRAGFYNNIIGSEKLSMYIEIGYGMEEIITSEIIEQQLEQTLDNLHRIGIIQDHKLVDWQALVMSPAYVHITKDSNQFVKQLMNELSEHQIYTIGRYGQWKYCSIEDCMVDAAEVSKRI